MEQHPEFMHDPRTGRLVRVIRVPPGGAPPRPAAPPQAEAAPQQRYVPMPQPHPHYPMQPYYAQAQAAPRRTIGCGTAVVIMLALNIVGHLALTLMGGPQAMAEQAIGVGAAVVAQVDSTLAPRQPLETARLRVEVDPIQLDAAGTGTVVTGVVTNISPEAVSIPISAFSFTVGAKSYGDDRDLGAILEPGQSTTLALALPIPPQAGITLEVLLPPDPMVGMELKYGAQAETKGGPVAHAAEAVGAHIPEDIAHGAISVLGPSTLTAAQIDTLLARYGSPAAGTGQAWIDAGEKHGLNAAVALAFFVMESTMGTAPGWAGHKPDGTVTHNVGNIICAGYSRCHNRFRDYGSWEEGIGDWFRLIRVEYVDGRGTVTLGTIIPIYAPSFENDVDGYVATVGRLLLEWQDELLEGNTP